MSIRAAAVHRIAMPDPGDAAGLAALIDAGVQADAAKLAGK